MKLRHQGLLLIGVPLFCQLIFVGALIVALLNLEKAATKESRAKQLLAKVDDLRNSLGLSYIALSSMTLSGSEEYRNTFEQARIRLRKKLADLQRETKRDAKSERVFAGHIATMSHLLDLLEQSISDHQEKSSHIAYARFLNEHEFMEEITLSLHKLTAGSLEIQKEYAPLVSELKPQAAARREQLRLMIEVGIVLNSALAIFLAMSFTRNTIRRLDRLNSNMDKFASGELDLKPVGGNDEIATIDDRFRKIATAKHESEEMRRSILNMVSHDMRSPLTSLHATLELALQGAYGALEPRMSKILVKCDSEIMRLIRLANDLLDAELIHEGKFELHFDEHFVETIFHQSINAVRGMSEHRSIAIKQILPEGLEVRCDGDRVVQIVVNLLSNAIKYAPKESTVTLQAAVDDKQVRIEIIDQGKGISEEDKLRVFEKFEQLSQPTETQKQGKGLGLAICKTLVEKHGGTIGVESEIGNGACFWFTLPRQSIN